MSQYQSISTSTCKICDNNRSDFSVPNCNHQFCQECLQTFLIIKITEGEVLDLTCPETGCLSKISAETVKSLIPEYFEKFSEFTERKSKESDHNFRWCPKPGCSGFDIKKTSNRLQCNQCQLNFCYFCAEIWHEHPCKEFESKSEMFRRCPQCSVVIEKSMGCPQLSCSVCGYRFCWLCGQDMYKHSFRKCVFASRKGKFHWVLAGVLLFFPVVLLFFIPFLLLGGIYSDDGIEKYKRSKGKYVIGFVLGFFCSPVLVGPLVFVFILTCSLVFLVKVIRNLRINILCRVLCVVFTVPLLFALLFIGFGVCVFSFIAASPIFGLVLLVSKIILIFY